jgi:hypothetical protein
MLSLDERNIRLFSSNVFTLYPHIYGPAIGDIRSICQLQLGIAYMRDFRTRAKKSRYFANALVEPPEPTSSMIAHAHTRTPLPNSSSIFQPSLTPTRSTSHGRPALTTPDDMAAFSQLTSRMSFASISEDSPSTPPPVPQLLRTQQGTPSPAKKRELPLLVSQLLGSLSEGQARVSDVLWVYNHVGRQGQEEALIDVGVNRAVARALAFLLD